MGDLNGCGLRPGLSFCGSQGVELFEPLALKGRKGSGLPGGRNAYAETSLEPAFDFEKYECAYRVWGRNIYNPGRDPNGWQRNRPQIDRAPTSWKALASASRIFPLVTTAHCPPPPTIITGRRCTPTCAMVPTQTGPLQRYAEPRLLGTVSPLDPEFFPGADEFAGELLNGERAENTRLPGLPGSLEEAADQATMPD